MKSFAQLQHKLLDPTTPPHKPTPAHKVSHRQLVILQKNHALQSNYSYHLLEVFFCFQVLFEV